MAVLLPTVIVSPYGHESPLYSSFIPGLSVPYDCTTVAFDTLCAVEVERSFQAAESRRLASCSPVEALGRGVSRVCACTFCCGLVGVAVAQRRIINNPHDVMRVF